MEELGTSAISGTASLAVGTQELKGTPAFKDITRSDGHACRAGGCCSQPEVSEKKLIKDIYPCSLPNKI